jgi:hypothetical protein
MREHRVPKYRPALELLEAKRPLSASGAATPLASLHEAAHAAVVHPVDASSRPVSPAAKKPNHGFLLYRITNPQIHPNTLIPPFQQVLVQANKPVPGQVYNVLWVAMKNGTAQTFNASSGFQVKFSGSKYVAPILTGDQTWKPRQDIVFYVLTKQYYPVTNQVHGGFRFNLGGAGSTAIPGPSGIFLRIKYEPANFARILNWIVAFGPGTQGGKGVRFGMPVTSINAFLSAKTRKMDFGGYF